MHILLPPSQGKRSAGDGPPLDLAGLSFPELNPAREKVLAALAEVCTHDDAQQALGYTPGQADEVERMRALRAAPTLPAGRLYTGVLYDYLGLDTVDPDLAERSILIFSGLWGVLRTTDRIPPYRLAMSVTLPPFGKLAALWRPALDEVLHPDGLVVDMRSAAYASVWRAPQPAIGVRVLRERVLHGVVKRTVVSHMAKATRGKIAGDLLRAEADPATPEDLAKALLDLDYDVELTDTSLDVIIR